MPIIKFKITNLDCPACIKLSTMALEGIAGVAKATVDLNSGLAELTADREVGWEEITAALKTVDKTAVQLT
ncbi:MAG: cation transporter [Patescibacteria group bacterium]